VDINSAVGRASGLTADQLGDVENFRKSAHFTAAEQAALAYAEEMTKTPVDVPDMLFAEVRRHFTEDAIVELSAMIALENFRARINHALDIPSDNLCELPARHTARTAAG
jgi:alkylhydroperoxidase family enzyme